MAGKIMNVAEWIEAGREDTEIYPVLEKYGCIDKIKRTDEELYMDVTAIQKLDGLRGIMAHAKEAKEMFELLPVDIRKEFNNDINKFSREAPEWLKKLNEKINAKTEKENLTKEEKNVTE